MLHSSPLRRLVVGAAVVASVAAVTLPTATAAQPSAVTRYAEHDLVSDIAGRADLVDPSLVNPWGLAQSPISPVWVANNHSNTATIYRGDAVVGPPSIVPFFVSVPGDGPTGQVFNPTSGFVVSDGAGHSGPALFLFDSESGDITGWSPAVPPPAPSTHAQPAAHVDGAIYKGLALATVGTASYLYAANFHTGGIDVFDSSFHRVLFPAGAFSDPNLPFRFAPFNVAALNGELFVAYAKQDAAKTDEVAGPGVGVVDVFDTTGHLLRRLVSHGALNAPWGMAIAPAGFGTLSGDLLVGNFGNGRINAYDPTTGAWHGALKGTNGRPLAIAGLWALMFGNGTTASTTSLLFTAGIDNESHGLYGAINVAG